jgi:hypothetical protein
MPGTTHRDAKVSKGALRAQAKMDKVTKGVVKDPSTMDPNMKVGVIVKVLGNGGFRVCLDDKKEVAAKIYSKTLRKAKCWQSGSLVFLCSGARSDEFEIEALLERKDAKRCELVPRWMLTVTNGATIDDAVKQETDGGFVFEDESEEEEIEEKEVHDERLKKGHALARQKTVVAADDDDPDIDNI